MHQIFRGSGPSGRPHDRTSSSRRRASSRTLRMRSLFFAGSGGMRTEMTLPGSWSVTDRKIAPSSAAVATSTRASTPAFSGAGRVSNTNRTVAPSFPRPSDRSTHGVACPAGSISTPLAASATVRPANRSVGLRVPTATTWTRHARSAGDTSDTRTNGPAGEVAGRVSARPPRRRCAPPAEHQHHRPTAANDGGQPHAHTLLPTGRRLPRRPGSHHTAGRRRAGTGFRRTKPASRRPRGPPRPTPARPVDGATRPRRARPPGRARVS